jgi:hypothetical protein
VLRDRHHKTQVVFDHLLARCEVPCARSGGKPQFLVGSQQRASADGIQVALHGVARTVRTASATWFSSGGLPKAVSPVAISLVTSIASGSSQSAAVNSTSENSAGESESSAARPGC